MTRFRRLWMAFAYVLVVFLPAYQAIQHTESQIQYLKTSYETNNIRNNGAVKEAEVWKELTNEHKFLGPIIKQFFEPSLDKNFRLPPLKEARQYLDKLPDLRQQALDEASAARLWSLVLLAISFLYAVLAFVFRSETRSDHLYALTLISVVFLAVGVTAPAMAIIVSPHTPVFPRFVLYYQFRSILGVILELYSSSYWFVGVCLTIFSILIPLFKAGLTIFALETSSLSKRLKISEFLHFIGKWSMADVFVAAILLAHFAVRSNKSTQADLFIGFYYFLSYCLLSMVTTTLLENRVKSLPGEIRRRHQKPSRSRPRTRRTAGTRKLQKA